MEEETIAISSDSGSNDSTNFECRKKLPLTSDIDDLLKKYCSSDSNDDTISEHLSRKMANLEQSNSNDYEFNDTPKTSGVTSSATCSSDEDVRYLGTSNNSDKYSLPDHKFDNHPITSRVSNTNKQLGYCSSDDEVQFLGTIKDTTLNSSASRIGQNSQKNLAISTTTKKATNFSSDDVQCVETSKVNTQYTLDDLDLEPQYYQPSPNEFSNILSKYATKSSSIISKQNKQCEKQKQLDEKKAKDEEKRQAKELKTALKIKYKNMKPENCIKYIKIHFDRKISEQNYFEDIKSELNKSQIAFSVENNQIPNCVFWTRHLDELGLDNSMELEELVVIMEGFQLIELINNGEFLDNLVNIKAKHCNKKIILVIYGLEKYFRLQKSVRNKELADFVRNVQKKPRQSELPVISRHTVEYALTELQILYNISNRMLDKKAALSLYLLQVTKSIAEKPYKLEKAEQLKNFRWYVPEDNRNCVKVDKDGNGLPRLWRQMLSSFPSVGLETAEAMTLVYPTVSKLMSAYENVQNEEEGEKLLQDIQIRRNIGLINTGRRIGPVLSKKMYRLFTSLNGDEMVMNRQEGRGS